MASNILFSMNFGILGTAAAPAVNTGAPGPWIPVDQAVRLRIVCHSTAGTTTGTVTIESSDVNTAVTTPFVTDGTTFAFTTADTVKVASYYLNTDKAFGPFVRANITSAFTAGGVYVQLQAWR